MRNLQVRVRSLVSEQCSHCQAVPVYPHPAPFPCRCIPFASVAACEPSASVQADPPSWLANLRREGPHPRQVVAAKLRVSVSGLARAGITGPLTTAEIENLKAERPDWLEREQAVQAEVRKEELRLKQQRAKA